LTDIINRAIGTAPDGATHFRLYEMKGGRGRPRQVKDDTGCGELDMSDDWTMDKPPTCALKIEWLRREGTGYVTLGETTIQAPPAAETPDPPASAPTASVGVTTPAGGETEASRALRIAVMQNEKLMSMLMSRADEDRADARRERDLRESAEKEHARAWAEAAAESDGSAITSEVLGTLLGNEKVLSSILSFFQQKVPPAGA